MAAAIRTSCALLALAACAIAVPRVQVTNVTGAGIQEGVAIAADSQGNTYLLAQTDSPYIDIPGLPRTSCISSTDIVLVKLTTTPVWARCFGGSWEDRPSAIAIGGDGSIYIAGSTNSPDFPGPKGGQTTARSLDGFVIKLAADGTTIIWTVLVGGASDDRINTLALSPSGDVYIGGDTQSSDLPVIKPFASGLRGIQDGFLARLSASTGAIVFCTYVGGAGTDRILAVATDSAGNAYVAGATDSADFPLTAPLIASRRGAKCGFVAKLRADGAQMLYSTYLCGSHGTQDGSEQVNAISVSAAGVAYVAGVTSSSDFPLANPYQSIFHGWDTEAFLTAFAPDGSKLLFSTLFGGAQSDAIAALKLDEARGVLTVAGSTLSLDLPGAAGATGAFAVQFTTDGQYWKTLPSLGADLVPAGLAIAPGQVLIAGTQRASAGQPAMAFAARIADQAAQIIWTNDATRQATVWQLHGPRGQLQSAWWWMHSAGAPGWKIVGLGDLDRNGATDLIWQQDSTRQVTAWYQSGPQNTANTGWQWINAAGAPGWTVVATADFDRNGIPDLVWQNDTTRQVTVWYMGGSQGNVNLGWAWLHAAGAPGWRVVAAADFNGDGIPDLIWQNDATRQVTIWYMSGSQGNVNTGWDWMNSAGAPGWRVAGAADVDGDGVPDLIWQNDATRQATVWYMGGANGNVNVGWDWIYSAPAPSWTITAAK
jgi:hypothetical protein